MPTIYDLEISDERWDRLVDNLSKLDQSRNDGKKHYAKLAVVLADELLDDELSQIEADVDSIKRKISNIEDILEAD